MLIARIHALASVLFLLAGSAQAIEAVGDFDGDGLSDLSVAQVGPVQTAWLSRGSSGAENPYYVFDGVPDALVSGRYFRGDNRSYPGGVFRRGAEALEWRIKNRFVGESVVRFGQPGDTIPNQADLDCDGITDFTVARNGTASNYPGFKLWYIATSSKPGYVQQLLFGLAGDQIGTTDMDGDGCAELVAFRNDYTWYTRKLFQDSTTQFQWGAPGDIPLLPRDFDNDGRADYVVSRVTGPFQVALVKLASGGQEFLPLGFSTSIPMAGNFIGGNLFAWVERAAGMAAIMQFDRSAFVFNFATPTNTLIRPDGTVVKPNEFPWGSGIQQIVPGAVAATPTTPSTPEVSGNEVRCEEKIKISDGSGGFVNNPHNSRNTMKVIFPKSLTGRIADVDLYYKGNHYEELAEGSTLEWGERERYYGHKSIGSYPDNIQVVVSLKNGEKACVTIPDPQKRWD